MKKISLIITALMLVMVLSFASAESLSSPSVIVSLLEVSFTDDDDVTYDFSYDEDSGIYRVGVTLDGFAMLAYMAKTNDEMMSSWLNIREALLTIGDTVLDFVREMSGDNDAFVSVFLINDQNPDAVLFSSLNSIVIYDYVTDEALITD